MKTVISDFKMKLMQWLEIVEIESERSDREIFSYSECKRDKKIHIKESNIEDRLRKVIML